MFKRILAIAAMVCVLPALASAQDGTLVTWAKSAGGNIQTSLTGVIDSTSFKQTSAYGKTTKSYTNKDAVTVKVTANPGYQAVYENVGCTGVENNVGASTFTCSAGVSSVYATFTYNPVKIAVTATAAAGGKVNIASISNIFYGQKLLNPITFKFTPATGYKVSAITLNGGATTGLTVNPAVTSATVGQSVVVTFPADYQFLADKALAASFTYAAPAPTAKTGAPQTVVSGAAVTLSGAGSLGSPTSYTWVQTAGPAAVTLSGASTATAGFTAPATTGTYYFKLTVNGGSTATATVIVSDSVLAAAKNQCVNCHVSNGVGVSPVNVYANWSSGSHGNKGVMCSKCHIGANTAAHPGSIPSTIQLNTTGADIAPDANGFVTANACQNCHKASHDEWKESLHTLKAKKGPALLNGSTENISPWALGTWSTMKTHQILGRKANITSKNYIEMYVSVDKKQPQDVAVVIGQDRKQRYAVYYDGSAQDAYVVYSNNGGITYREKMIDDDNNAATPLVWERVAMPAQPDRAGYMFLWLEVKLTGATPAMNADNYEEWRSWQERCIGCHTTGFDRVAYNSAKTAYTTAFAANGNQPPAGLDMKTVYVSEWEISCEACHGAGAEHAQTGDKTKIVSPAKLAQGDHVRREVCESCHTRTNKNLVDTATANDRRGFRLGIDSYSNWMDYTSPAWGSGNRQVSIDGKGRRDHQMTMDIQLSKYIHEVVENGFSYHGNQNCFDCHKSHDVGINKNGQNVWKDNMNSAKYGHDNMKSLATDDGVRSTLRLKDTREALCAPCHVTAAPAGVLPAGVTAPQYASVTDLVKVFDSKTGATYGYTFDAAGAVLSTSLYASDPAAATALLPLVASNWTTEGGRDGRQSHIFNKDAAAVPTNKAMGLKPEEYTWEITTAKVGLTTTVTADYTAIWPWATAASGKTKVYGPLTNLGAKPPLATRPYQP